MLILHAFFALLAGFATMAAMIALATLVLARIMPGKMSGSSSASRTISGST
uniref:Uncharacterized protein n=1 Tax=mine drainage metagenome TaxID=410659 RepID=E6QJS2_9ZZZZ